MFGVHCHFCRHILYVCVHICVCVCVMQYIPKQRERKYFVVTRLFMLSELGGFPVYVCRNEKN